MTMIYHVHAVEQDMAGKWYARVVLTEDEAQFFTFGHFPTMDEIQNAAAAFVEDRTSLERPLDPETGQFIGDDPGTPENEAWMEVAQDGPAE